MVAGREYPGIARCDLEVVHSGANSQAEGSWVWVSRNLLDIQSDLKKGQKSYMALFVSTARLAASKVLSM